MEVENKRYAVNDLLWDTQYFGVKCGKIDILDRVNSADENEIKEYLLNKNFVTITNSSSQNNRFISGIENCYLTDVNVQLEKKISSYNSSEISGDIKINNNKKYNLEIIEIAQNAFKFSRFINDNNIEKCKAIGIYENWVINSFYKENKYFVCYEKDNVIYGFIIFNIENNICTIELIAVNHEYRAMGIGKKMMNSLDGFCCDKNISLSKVGTQIENIGALNFYQSCGYKIKSIKQIYHVWIN